MLRGRFSLVIEIAIGGILVHKTDTTLTGAAGEHLVLSRLLQRGIVAAQAPEGVRKVDVLVNFLDGGTPCFIQVKARQFGSDGGWHMGVKHESIIDDDVFYAFVDFQPEHPTVHLMPAKVVAEAVATAHKIWLETPGTCEGSALKFRERLTDGWTNFWSAGIFFRLSDGAKSLARDRSRTVREPRAQTLRAKSR